MSGSGDVIAGRYRLVSQLGSGGMGRVWLARDETLHRDVAIKEVVLPPDLAGAERDELHQRTLREARAAGRLSHPNVVAIYDVIQAEGRPWIVMELVRSRSLYQVLRDDGPVTPKRAAQIGLAILAALRAAHKAGVWHRDVKPGNVLLADDGRVVLTDFGLATYDGDGAVTRSGVILGSAQFIAPERARDGVSGPETDMWSLGATLYAAVEGRSPYARQTPMATLTALATVPPDPPRRAGALRPVLMGLLRRNPRHRLGAAAAEKLLKVVASSVRPSTVAAPLTTHDAGDGGVDASRTDTQETYAYLSPRRPLWPWAVSALAVVLVVAAAVAGWRALDGPGAVTAGPTTADPDVAALTAGMGVQACVEQPAENEAPIPADTSVRPGEYGLLAGWTYYRDPSGFHLAVPQTWRMSRVGPLWCFRDPSSPKAIAVLDQGEVNGAPSQLLAEGELAWRDAAGLTGYVRLGITDVHYDEGAADLEYTYVDGNTVMHGRNRMLRLNGRVFTLFWLTTDFSWTADRALVDVLQPSFGLEA
jgi:hypothetical protein